MMSTAAREKGRLPKRIIWSPSLESSTLSSAVAQYSNEAFSAATSLSLGSVSASFASGAAIDRKSTRLNSSHRTISYAVFCLKKKKKKQQKNKQRQVNTQ